MPTNATINIELILNAAQSKEVLFEFRNYLRNEIPGFDFNFKEIPPRPGVMGSEFQLLDAVLYATTVASVELAVHKSLESLNENIIEKIKDLRDKFVKEKKLGELGISGSVKHDHTKSTFKITDNKIKYFNDQPYSIDPYHTYVFLAGCSEFQSANINDIPSAAGNLTELYRLMTDVEYFGIPADHITVSLNQNNDVIQDNLYEISRTPGIETFIFYYVGHGFCTDKDSYFLAAANTQKKSDFINSGIDKEFIKTRILAQSPAKQKIAIIDACYSGILTQGGSVNMFDANVTGSYILTSSNAEEVSFYDKDKEYTFFTGALVNVLKEGTNNLSDSLTLDDLYLGTCKLLEGKKLQQPTYKNGLNIDPSKFIIARNASFSPETELATPAALIKQAKYEEASYEYKRLIKKYPDNKNLQESALKFENEWSYSKLIKEADLNYYKLKNYSKAKEMYEKALGLIEDRLTRDKLNDCIKLSEGKNKFPFSKKTILSFVAIFFAAMASFLIFHKSEHSDKNTESKMLPSNDTALKTPANLIRKDSPVTETKVPVTAASTTTPVAAGNPVIHKDSLYFMKGLKFRESKTYDSAKYYFEQSIQYGGLKAPVVLALMYEDGTPATPKNIDMAIKILETAVRNGAHSAMVNLGNLYEVKSRYMEAVDMYLSAVRVGNLMERKLAYHELGNLYNVGNVEVPKNPTLAKKYFTEGCNIGDKYCCDELRKLTN